MNRTPDVELVLRDYFADDGLTAPDHVLETVEGRISRQRQRRAWRLLWRHPMSTPFKLAAGVAAVVLVALVGWQFLPGQQNGFGGQPSPTPPTLQPSATPLSSQVVDLPEGLLPGGRYRLQPLGESSSLTIVADIPAGWIGYRAQPALTNPEGSNDGVLIGFMVTDGLYSDPCHWDLDGTGAEGQPGDVGVGPTVDDLVAALKRNTSYTASAATPVTLGQFEGQEVELQLPGDDVIRTCDRRPGESTGDYFVIPEGYYAQGPNSRWHLYIVDVDGIRLITMVSIAEGTSQADIAAAEAIVDSFQISP